MNLSDTNLPSPLPDQWCWIHHRSASLFFYIISRINSHYANISSQIVTYRIPFCLIECKSYCTIPRSLVDRPHIQLNNDLDLRSALDSSRRSIWRSTGWSSYIDHRVLLCRRRKQVSSQNDFRCSSEIHFLLILERGSDGARSPCASPILLCRRSTRPAVYGRRATRRSTR